MTFLDKLKSVQAFIFDMDGVLTDGSLTLMPGGAMARRMNVKDGYALQLAIKKGYLIAIISGSDSEEAVVRFNKLGITDVWMKAKDKIVSTQSFLKKNNLSWNNVLYMGDDIPDLEVMKKVGISCCPADAVQEIKNVSAFISHINGGMGCVRDIIEKVLKLRGDWNEDISIPST